MTRPPNVMGHYPAFLGMAPMGFNQYLEAPIETTPSLETFVWEDGILTFYTPKISQGIIDHIHYQVRTDGIVPTISEMATAPVWQSDSLLIALPEASGIFVHMLAHDHFHRPRESDYDLTSFGEFWSDLTPPTGTLFVAGGAPVTLEQTVRLHIIASDNLSGVAEMYIEGDVQGEGVLEWVAYEEFYDVTLSDIEGKHTVLVRLKDYAGNESSVFFDSIVYPLVRYFFRKEKTMANTFKQKNNSFTVQVNNMRESNNQMKESDEHGRLSSN